MSDLSQMIGPLTPQIVCWASLVFTVAGLVIGFYYTNITAFARRLRNGTKQPTGGFIGRPTGHGPK